MRLFIALDLPAELYEWVRERQKELKRLFTQPEVRWMPTDQWHVTLRFLGEWPEHKTAAALAAMKRAAEETPAFSISFGKLESFSGPRMGVLWIGVETGSELLAQLAARLNKHLEVEGFPTEERPFRAHVTLARSREKIPATALRRFPSPPPSPEAVMNRLHLYQSTLTPAGAHYTLLHMAFLRRFS